MDERCGSCRHYGDMPSGPLDERPCLATHRRSSRRLVWYCIAVDRACTEFEMRTRRAASGKKTQP